MEASTKSKNHLPTETGGTIRVYETKYKKVQKYERSERIYKSKSDHGDQRQGHQRRDTESEEAVQTTFQEHKSKDKEENSDNKIINYEHKKKVKNEITQN